MATSIPVKELPDGFASELGAASAGTLSWFPMHFSFLPSIGEKEYYLIEPLQVFKIFHIRLFAPLSYKQMQKMLT